MPDRLDPRNVNFLVRPEVEPLDAERQIHETPPMRSPTMCIAVLRWIEILAQSRDGLYDLDQWCVAGTIFFGLARRLVSDTPPRTNFSIAQ